MDVLARLSDEHAHLRVHLEHIQTAADVHDDQALNAALGVARVALTSELDAHIALEEAMFQGITEDLGEGLFVPFREEHIEIRTLRDAVMAAVEHGTAPHGAALRLCELILDHQRREDHMLFPSARQVMPADS